MTQETSAPDALINAIADDPVLLAVGAKAKLDSAARVGVGVDEARAKHEEIVASLTEDQFARYNARTIKS